MTAAAEPVPTVLWNQREERAKMVAEEEEEKAWKLQQLWEEWVEYHRVDNDGSSDDEVDYP